MTPTTIVPAVSSALLREVPRFFSGPGAALQELLLNAVRAGATRVTITQDGAAVTVTDDGRGCDDPQVLLTAAQSGWTDPALDPAGLGALSVLNPAFAAQVTYASHDWTFTVTPEAFAAAQPVTVQRRPHEEGFTVRIDHHTPPTGLRDLVQARRGYAPLEVTVDGVVVPPTTPPGHALATHAGTVHLWRSHQPGLTCVWEHFPLDGAPLWTALRHHADPVVQSATYAQAMTLVIDPASGLRPTLPDRVSLHDDAAVTAAADAIATVLGPALRTAISAALHLGSASMPEYLYEHRAVHTYGTLAVHTVLREHGYVPAVRTDPTTLSATLYRSPGGDESPVPDWRWVHPATDVALADEPTSLGWHWLGTLGFTVPVGTPDGPAPEVTFGTVTPVVVDGDDTAFTVGVTDTLTLNGHPVPALVQVDGNHTWYTLLLRGTPEEAEAFVRAHTAAIGGLVLAALASNHELRGLVSESLSDDEGLHITAEETGRTVLLAIISTFSAERDAARRESADLAAELRQGAAALDAMTEAGDGFPALMALLEAPAAALRSHLTAQRERRAALIERHRLA